jgi:uncharacterized membrane protein
MGIRLFDQYTYLHFAVGIIVYFWSISILNWFILHTIFEFLENTQMGMNIITPTKKKNETKRIKYKLLNFI